MSITKEKERKKRKRLKDIYLIKWIEIKSKKGKGKKEIVQAKQPTKIIIIKEIREIEKTYFLALLKETVIESPLEDHPYNDALTGALCNTILLPKTFDNIPALAIP